VTQQECLNFFLAAPGTSAVQPLPLGGEYVIDSVATGTGTIDLQKLFPDGSWVAVITQINAATAKEQVVILAPGQYRVVSATFTNAYVSVARASVG
jgi:hypothetical protein